MTLNDIRGKIEWEGSLDYVITDSIKADEIEHKRLQELWRQVTPLLQEIRNILDTEDLDEKGEDSEP